MIRPTKLKDSSECHILIHLGNDDDLLHIDPNLAGPNFFFKKSGPRDDVDSTEPRTRCPRWTLLLFKAGDSQYI